MGRVGCRVDFKNINVPPYNKMRLKRFSRKNTLAVVTSGYRLDLVIGAAKIKMELTKMDCNYIIMYVDMGNLPNGIWRSFGNRIC
jgi:hypothetical protein